MTPQEFEIALHDAEIQLSRIKHLYEQYFQGIERIEPQISRKQFDRALHRLRKYQPRNTALRFRFQTLIQRYTTLQTYWRRIARQIEEGTYRRDLLRARKRREAARAKRDESRGNSRNPLELDPEESVDVDELIEQASNRVDELRKEPAAPAQKPSRKLAPLPRPAPQRADESTATFGKPKSATQASTRDRSSPAISPSRRAPPPIASRSKGPGEARMRQIYDSYVDAKRRNNERTDKIDYETVAKSLKKMVPKLDRKHKGKRIDFKVVVQEGKVGIKPVVKK
ncbi:MAG: MXAN_5187 C-terminal domain-containing protein [Polyangiales bacterium]